MISKEDGAAETRGRGTHFDRMCFTRSSAHSKPPSTASHFSCPRGGSPRSATMLVTPWALQPSSASSTFSGDMLVQVRCMLGIIPFFFVARVSSSVRSEVEPPAPHVKSAKSGLKTAMRSSRACRFFTPSSVRGG